MRLHQKILFLILAIVLSNSGLAQTRISVHCDQEKFTMKGGIGASWHAISMGQSFIDESSEYKYALRVPNSRGSAWGGNPPPTESDKWEQIYDHASWLGLSFLRVELSMRMYQPEKGIFDWDNEEMQALYLILDWAEANDADVFLQQMWSNVKWNSYADVQPLISAPKSLEDFGNGLANLVDYLVNEKKYTCIKWLCISNEPPGGTWGHWWSSSEFGGNTPITPGLKAVREALDRKSLVLPISGPDWTDLPPFDAGKIDFDEYIGAYDIHSYHGITKEKQEEVEKWANWAREHHKPLFLTEIGRQDLVFGIKNPESTKTGDVVSIAESLSNAEDILRGMAVGVSAFNRWSFTNRGDLDGQWQLIRTWNLEKKEFYQNIEPEPVSYYGYGIITRFVPKHSTVVLTEQIENQGIMSQTIKSPSGEITTIILNKSPEDQEIQLVMTGVTNKELYLYRVTEPEVLKPGFKMNPIQKIMVRNEKEIALSLPPKSISTLTNFHITHDQMPKDR